MARGRPKKNPFDDLDVDYKTLIENGSDDEIRRKISDVALAESENQELRKADQDLQEKTESARFAGESYKENSRHNKLRINYARFLLQSRGKL